jgi:hypothetical protein
MAKLALVGGGPAFRKAGRDPLYTRISRSKGSGVCQSKELFMIEI